MVETVCPHCLKTFLINPFLLKNGKTRCCSASCGQRHRTRASVNDRFFSKVEKSDGCWIWKGCVNKDGYGKMGDGAGSSVGAHIVSWTLANGPVPAGMNVCHECDNPPCVKPDHLFLGTQLDNIQDRVKKNRCASGVRSYRHTLDPEKVLSMRRMRESGISYREIGEAFGVNDSAAWKAINGSTWRRVG